MPKPIAPPPALRSNPATFAANAEAQVLYIPEAVDYIDEQADIATAAATGLPDYTGSGGKVLGILADETAPTFYSAPLLLASQDMTGLSEFVLSGFDPAQFTAIEVHISNLGGGAAAQLSYDGTTFDSGASDYYYDREGETPGSSSGDDSVLFTTGISANSGKMTIYLEPAAIHNCELVGAAGGGTGRANTAFGRVGVSSDILGLRVFRTSGTFLYGRITAMGIPR